MNKIFAAIIFTLLFITSAAYADDVSGVAVSESIKTEIDALAEKVKTAKGQKQKKILMTDLAETLVKIGNSDGAIDLYKEILNGNLSKKDQFDYNVKIGDLYYLKKEYASTLNYYSAARALYENNAEVNLKIGNTFLSSNLYTLAERNFLEVLSRNKRSDYAKRRLGDVYLKQDMYLKAIEYYESVDHFYINRETVINMVACYRNLNNSQKAVNLINNSLRYDDDAEILFLLGMLYFDEKKYKEAEGAFLKSIGVNSSNATAYIYLAVVYESVSELQKAKEFLDKSAKINPALAVTDLMRARISYKMKNISAAKVYAKNAYANAKTPFLQEQAQRMTDFFNGK
ncbi:tetratricopeptide repeat protein [Endomicrobium proavitum]|uniref:Tetratricopeptide domain-containing protein n=1 Tax=Endomicrobium proavitum TaxID=1408281 RepID=A0A0G3WIK9_9BACT|nr:tetratricopeptide repeat protein [Endomicrobium proavitum]AKL98143.1 Tetratricopeptide domain-containing protein [Endomicrobium proavitum]